MEIWPPWMSFQLVAFTKELQIRKLHQWHFSIPLQETWLVYAASLLTVNAGSKASWISGSQGIVYLRLKTVSLQGIQGFPPVKLKDHEQISSILSILRIMVPTYPS
jgi:hypothetical protein